MRIKIYPELYFPSIFVTLKGRNDVSIEFLALISTASDFCVIPRMDAYLLGYAEVVSDPSSEMITRPPYLLTLVSPTGYADAPHITIKEVSVGSLVYKDIDFIAYDIPRETRFDVILGKSFLEKAKVKIDYQTRTIEFEEHDSA